MSTAQVTPPQFLHESAGASDPRTLVWLLPLVDAVPGRLPLSVLGGEAAENSESSSSMKQQEPRCACVNCM